MPLIKLCDVNLHHEIKYIKSLQNTPLTMTVHVQATVKPVKKKEPVVRHISPSSIKACNSGVWKRDLCGTVQ